LAKTPAGEVWLAWDSYDGREYGVFTRRVAPSFGPVERLSKPGRDGLKPAMAATPDGLALAWVATEEVEGHGVLDHADSLHFAFRRGASWQLHEDAADLRHGLLPQIEPKPSSMSGYAGRRRHPMLAIDGGAVWLLWERKAGHDAPSFTTGQLCARRFENGRWSEPRIVHNGLVDYRAALTADRGRLRAAGKDIHHYYQTFAIDLNSGRPVVYVPFPGWKTNGDSASEASTGPPFARDRRAAKAALLG
jgi:hypothetical protein